MFWTNPALIVGITSFVITGLAIIIARKMQIVAHPVERSSHDKPTPQVGGIGICLSMLLVLPFISRWTPSATDLHWLFFLLIAYGFCIGLVDDFLALSALKKLLLLFGLALIPATYLFLQLNQQTTGTHSYTLHVYYLAGLCFLWVVFFSNAFNFMDGVNGQSGFFTLQALVWFAWIFGDGERQLISLLLAAAVFGFLVWNFPWGATFMGDSGSLPLGATLAVLSIFSYDGGEWTQLLPPFLILLPYTYDVIYTLLLRSLRGENLLEAHRCHLYQRLLIATDWSHSRLLAFHIPYYIAFGLLAVTFSSGSQSEWIFPVIASIFLLLIYTAMVWKCESKAESKA